MTTVAHAGLTTDQCPPFRFPPFRFPPFRFPPAGARWYRW